MKIHVRLAEPFWRAVGERNLKIELADRSCVADLIALLEGRYPALQQEFLEAVPMIFMGEDEAELETVLVDNGRLHFVWAIAGG